MKLEMSVFIMPHGWVGNVTVVAGRAGLALCVGIKMKLLQSFVLLFITKC